MADQPMIALPLADAQMLLAWMDETFGNDSGTDWHDEDAAAVGDALNHAVENFKAMRAALGVQGTAPACPGSCCDCGRGCTRGVIPSAEAQGEKP